MTFSTHSNVFVKYILATICWLLLLVTAAPARTYQFAAIEYPPYSYVKNGELTGSTVTLVKEAMKRIGQTATITLYPWSRGLEETKSGTVDGLLSTIKTPEREGYMLFGSEPLLVEGISLVVLKESGITWRGDLRSLSEYAFGGIRGFHYGADWDAAIASGMIAKLELAVDPLMNVRKLLAKRYDICIGDPLNVLYYAKQMRQINRVEVLHPPIESTKVYLAFSKINNLGKLAAQFDDAMRAMRKDGTYDRIIKTFH